MMAKGIISIQDKTSKVGEVDLTRYKVREARVSQAKGCPKCLFSVTYTLDVGSRNSKENGRKSKIPSSIQK